MEAIVEVFNLLNTDKSSRPPRAYTGEYDEPTLRLNPRRTWFPTRSGLFRVESRITRSGFVSIVSCGNDEWTGAVGVGNDRYWDFVNSFYYCGL